MKRPDLNGLYKENDLQRAAAVYLDFLAGLGLLGWNHTPNESKRSPRQGAQIKSHGMKKGHPDCDIFLPGNQTIFIELKMEGKYLSKEQKARHAELTALGYKVYVVKAYTPNEAVNKIKAILISHGVKAP